MFISARLNFGFLYRVSLEDIMSHSCIRQSSIVAKCVLASQDAASCPLADRVHQGVGHNAVSEDRHPLEASLTTEDTREFSCYVSCDANRATKPQKKMGSLKSSSVSDFLVKLGSAASEAVFT